MSCSVHDVVDFETRGIPSVAVATEPFLDGAERQSRALGLAPAIVYVAHPIQDRSEDEVRGLADRAADAVLAALVTGT